MLLLKAVFSYFLWQVNGMRNDGATDIAPLRFGFAEIVSRQRKGCIDVNRATTQKLTWAKGIGVSLAYRIVRARTCLLKDFDDLRKKLQAQQHPEGLWTFDRLVAPLFHSDPPVLCVDCESDPEKAKSPWKQKIIDVNVASLQRMLRAHGVGKGMAYRILMARSCFFTSYPNFEERFRATPSNSNLWKFVQDAIDAGEICITNAPSIESPANNQPLVQEPLDDENEDVELSSVDSKEQEVQASIVVREMAVQANGPETKEFGTQDDRIYTNEIGVQTDTRQTREFGAQTDGSMQTKVTTNDVQTQTEAVEEAVQQAVLSKVGDDFLPSQVKCSVETQRFRDNGMEIEMPEGNLVNEININIRVNVAFVNMVQVVQHAVQSLNFMHQVNWIFNQPATGFQGEPEIRKRGQLVAGPTNFHSVPVYQDTRSPIKDDFWAVMGVCGTDRSDFVGYENTPDWEVLPFTKKICRAHGCREAMTQFAQKYSRTCELMDRMCREASTWVSMLFFGSADCGDLLMAEKMHNELQVPLTACSPGAGGHCTVQCVHALRDFPGLQRGCRSADCTSAYVQLEGMYNAISNCPEPNVGNGFPINVHASGLVLVGLPQQCILAPLSGGWSLVTTELIYCSYFRPVPAPSGGLGKLVDPRTNLCFGWLHRHQQSLTWFIANVQGPALAPCNIQSPGTPDGFAEGYSFHSVWKTQGEQICVVHNSGQVTTWCLNTQSGPHEVIKDSGRTDIGQVAGVSKKGSKLVEDVWSFPLPPAPYSNLFRLENGDRCLVTPPNNGWGMISEDLEYCTYFQPVSIPGMTGPFGKAKDPRSGLCVGWVHQDGFPGALTIPGANGLAAGPCGDAMGDRMGQSMDFNTVLQHFVDTRQVCIMTNSGELTPYCFTLS